VPLTSYVVSVKKCVSATPFRPRRQRLARASGTKNYEFDRGATLACHGGRREAAGVPTRRCRGSSTTIRTSASRRAGGSWTRLTTSATGATSPPVPWSPGTRTLGVVCFDTTLYGPASMLYGIEQAAGATSYFVSIVSLRDHHPRRHAGGDRSSVRARGRRHRGDRAAAAGDAGSCRPSTGRRRLAQLTDPSPAVTAVLVPPAPVLLERAKRYGWSIRRSLRSRPRCGRSRGSIKA
jgi:hypothetical protein